MRIPPHKIDEVLNAIDIVELVGGYVPLKKRGRNYIALCPFHQEKTPSFNVNPERNIYKCFGCGKGGNGLHFVMEHEHMTFMEALKFLAEKYRIELEFEETKESEELKDAKESLYAVTNFANKYFQQKLSENEEGKTIGLSYFKERGFRDETIKKFELGYSLDSWDDFSKAAVKNQFSEEILLASGLSVSSSDDKKKLYDRFRGRVIFPIHNLSGKVIGFGGRVLKSSSEQAKYVNSPENEIYHKSYVLYGLWFAKNSIREKNECMLVEGYTDVISLHQNGIENAVASSGTSLTEEQVRLIRRYTPYALVLFDGDDAGIRASLRGIDLLLEQGLKIKAAVIPDGHDPDSYVNKIGGEAFREFLNKNAKDFLDFKIELLLKGNENNPIKKAEALGQIVESIAKIPDLVQQNVYVKYCSEKLNVAEYTLLSELNKKKIAAMRRRDSAYENINFEKENLTPEQLHPEDAWTEKHHPEEEIIRLLLLYGDEAIEGEKLYTYFIRELENIHFKTEMHNYLLNYLLDEYRKKGGVDVQPLVNHPNEEIKNLIVSMLTAPYELSENWERYDIFLPPEKRTIPRSVSSAILHLKLKKIKEMIQDNQKEIKNIPSEETHAERLNHLLGLHRHLEEIKINLSRELGIVVLK